MKPDAGSFSWVKRGRQRRVVLMVMTEIDMMPTEISHNTKDYGKKITLSNLSGVLKELLKTNLLTCENKAAMKGKLYSLAPKGKGYRKRLSRSSLFEKDK